jgi:signal transduction histidine kinase
VTIEELPTLQADPIQMHQMLQNLVANGLKYHHPDKHPEIRVHGQTMWNEDGRENIALIYVEDNGIGFDDSKVDYIFQPFSRLHGRTSYEGTGMGLTICSKIVERHGGTITARSLPGEGSVFIVQLPLVQVS